MNAQSEFVAAMAGFGMFFCAVLIVAVIWWLCYMAIGWLRDHGWRRESRIQNDCRQDLSQELSDVLQRLEGAVREPGSTYIGQGLPPHARPIIDVLRFVATDLKETHGILRFTYGELYSQLQAAVVSLEQLGDIRRSGEHSEAKSVGLQYEQGLDDGPEYKGQTV